MAELKDKVIITVAPTGSIPTRKDTPHLPVTAEEVAEETRRAYEAGASVDGDQNTCIGTNACKSGVHDGSIGLGAYAKPSKSNQFVVGSATTNLNISEAVFGSGVAKASPSY
jgi:hypothetical protein